MPHNYKLLVIIFQKKAKTACVGVVKATGLHEKSPSQHAADLQCVEQLDVLKKHFLLKITQKKLSLLEWTDEAMKAHCIMKSNFCGRKDT